MIKSKILIPLEMPCIFFCSKICENPNSTTTQLNRTKVGFDMKMTLHHQPHHPPTRRKLNVSNSQLNNNNNKNNDDNHDHNHDNSNNNSNSDSNRSSNSNSNSNNNNSNSNNNNNKIDISSITHLILIQL